MQKLNVSTCVLTTFSSLRLAFSCSLRAAIVITFGIWAFPISAQSIDAQLEQGKTLMITKGCSSCHQLTKLPAAKGLVGPPLDKMASQSYIAGVLPNSRENLTKFLLDPKKFHSDTAMPTPDISEQEARHITDYLFKE